MRNAIALGLVAVLAMACEGNPVAPVVTPSPVPEAPAPLPLPSPPKAVLTIGGGEVNPPLGIRSFTQLLFDGSQSTGDALTYRIEFGDGVSSTEPVARHRSEEPGPLDARLTVTDKHGRSDSTTQTYYRAPVANGSGWWFHDLQAGRRRIRRTLHLAQEGATLSGRYSGPEGDKRLTGLLSEDRAIRLQTLDGAIAFAGSMEWKGPDDLYEVLRLTVRGGSADGAVLDFGFVDPY